MKKKQLKNLRRYDRRENVVCALFARRELAVNTLQQLLARRRRVIDALKTLCKSCVDAVGRI